MAPKYKLIYFNVAARAEPIRYLFAYANQEFEDYRIKKEEWPELKPKTPFGKLPVLEVDGKQVNQSTSICRYLGKQFGLTGKDESEALQADVLVETLGDWHSLGMRLFREEDEAKLAEIKKEMAFYFEKFEKLASSNPSGLLVGTQVTWADVVFAATFSEGLRRNADLLKPYPALTKLVETINNSPNVKAYLERRPKTEPPPQGPPKK